MKEATLLMSFLCACFSAYLGYQQAWSAGTFFVGWAIYFLQLSDSYNE
jgi:hypothetical protein